MTELLNTLMQWLEVIGQHPALAYGLIFGILVITGAGIPVSEELLVFIGGFLLFHYPDSYSLLPMWLCCYIGILIADSIVIYIGWHFGKAVLHRKWVKRMLHPRRVLWAKHQVHDHGAWMIAISRFVPGSRYATLLISGMMHIKRWKFLVADGFAATISVSLQLFLGWSLGHVSSNLPQLWHDYHWEITLGTLAIGSTLAITYFTIHYLRKKASKAQ